MGKRDREAKLGFLTKHESRFFFSITIVYYYVYNYVTCVSLLRSRKDEIDRTVLLNPDARFVGERG